MNRETLLRRIVIFLLTVMISTSLEPFAVSFSYATEEQDNSPALEYEIELQNEEIPEEPAGDEISGDEVTDIPRDALMTKELAEEMPTGILNAITPETPTTVLRKKIEVIGRTPKPLGINLRKMLGEKHSGYSVSQGGCTDGTYAYYLMVSSYNQKGRVLKTRISDNEVVARSDVIDICHGNGMALDTKRNRLVVVGREGRRNELTIINVGNTEAAKPIFGGHYYVNYPYSSKWTSSKKTFDGYGLSAISYIEKYDCYIALQRKTHDLLVLDPNFRVIGLIGTKITEKYPGTYQAIDADDRYVYMLLSYYSSKQPYNIILVLDWHSENLNDYAAKSVAFVEKPWKCGTDGRPSAALRTYTPFEAENLYHVDQGDGTARFYLTEYHNNPQYHWVTKKKAYKVKWKKVKKKVKWKKVKKKGKWKWKYKTKKVWKYKKKYKKVKVKEVNYYNRDNYVYDLGIM